MIPKISIQISLEEITSTLGRFPRDLQNVLTNRFKTLATEIREKIDSILKPDGPGYHYGILARSIKVGEPTREIRSSGRVSGMSMNVFIDPEYSESVTYSKGKHSETYIKRPIDYWKAMERGRKPLSAGNIIFFEKKFDEQDKTVEIRRHVINGKPTGSKYEYKRIRDGGAESKTRIRFSTGTNFKVRERKNRKVVTRIMESAEALTRRFSELVMRDLNNLANTRTAFQISGIEQGLTPIIRRR